MRIVNRYAVCPQNIPRQKTNHRSNSLLRIPGNKFRIHSYSAYILQQQAAPVDLWNTHHGPTQESWRKQTGWPRSPDSLRPIRVLRPPVLNFVAGNHAVRSAAVQSKAVLLSVDSGLYLHHSSFRLDKARRTRSLGPRRAGLGQSHAPMRNVQGQLVVHENGGREIAIRLAARKNI